MSILFEQLKTGSWHGRYLDSAEFLQDGELVDGDDRPFLAALQDGASVAIRRLHLSQGECWVLITSPRAHVRLNDMDALLTLAVLADRDAIFVTDAISPLGRRFYFSTQSLARVEPAPADLSLACPRCKLPIGAHSSAVRCPRCRVWHHQRSDRECWTYSNRCAACHDQDTSLSGELSWTPEDL